MCFEVYKHTIKVEPHDFEDIAIWPLSLPLLFLVLISDIDQEVAASYISSFADDTRAAKGITMVEDAETTNWPTSHIQLVARKQHGIQLSKVWVPKIW